MMRNQEERRALVLSALIAAALLLFFSRSSPLYPANVQGEANAFFTMGRGMLAGKVPYRDLVLGAGPVVYALHALAALVSSTGFLGVWLIEIAAMTVTLYFAWKAANHISGMTRLSMGMAALMSLLLVSSRAFMHGDTVEQMVLPLQMFALCDLLIYLDDEERRMSSWRMAAHGFAAGCVFWMKFELMGVHLAFIAAMTIDDMVRQWELKGAVCMCAEFAAGAALATAPWLVYFCMNGALLTFLRAYLGGEWINILAGMSPVQDALAGLASGVINNPVCALVMLSGAGFLMHRLAHRRWNAGCTAVTAAFACTVLLVYMQGERQLFSPMSIGVFLMLCAGPLALLMRYAWNRRRAYAALAGCGLMICAGYNCLVNINLPYIGYPGDELPQAVFAQYIEEHDGGTVFTYNIPDCGFYLALDQIPQFRPFADSRAYYNVAMDRDDWKIVDREEPDWIISRSANGPAGYSCVKTADSPYDRGANREGKIYQYYLYRRFDWPE